MRDARKVFNEMSNRNNVSWNTFLTSDAPPSRYAEYCAFSFPPYIVSLATEETIGIGFGHGIPGMQVAFGVGAGCGFGFGFGYGAGKGVVRDDVRKYSNVGNLFYGENVAANCATTQNIVAAVYIPTGQDPAQDVESSNCLSMMVAINDGKDLHVSVTMSSIEVPNALPTAASASSDMYEAVVSDACEQIKAQIEPLCISASSLFPTSIEKLANGEVWGICGGKGVSLNVAYTFA